jgi:hypothetical protein
VWSLILVNIAHEIHIRDIQIILPQRNQQFRSYRNPTIESLLNGQFGYEHDLVWTIRLHGHPAIFLHLTIFDLYSRLHRLRSNHYSIVTSVTSTTFPGPFATKGDKSNDHPCPPPAWPFKRSACLFGSVSMNVTIGPDISSRRLTLRGHTCDDGARILSYDIGSEGSCRIDNKHMNYSSTPSCSTNTDTDLVHQFHLELYSPQ